MIFLVLIVFSSICQSCLSLVRALAPTFGGTVWSYSLRNGHDFPMDRHFVFYIIAAMSMFSFAQSFSIPKNVALGGGKK